jgi:hypothetical protein
LKWFIDFELFFNFIFLCFFFWSHIWSPFFCFYLFYFRHFLELIFFNDFILLQYFSCMI